MSSLFAHNYFFQRDFLRCGMKAFSFNMSSSKVNLKVQNLSALLSKTLSIITNLLTRIQDGAGTSKQEQKH